jgi:hypothetical protein
LHNAAFAGYTARLAEFANPISSPWIKTSSVAFCVDDGTAFVDPMPLDLTAPCDG